jgi:hypothetical protein
MGRGSWADRFQHGEDVLGVERIEVKVARLVSSTSSNGGPMALYKLLICNVTSLRISIAPPDCQSDFHPRRKQEFEDHRALGRKPVFLLIRATVRRQSLR